MNAEQKALVKAEAYARRHFLEVASRGEHHSGQWNAWRTLTDAFHSGISPVEGAYKLPAFFVERAIADSQNARKCFDFDANGLWRFSPGWNYREDRETTAREEWFYELKRHFHTSPKQHYGMTTIPRSEKGDLDVYTLSEGSKSYYWFPKTIDTPEQLIEWAHQFFDEELATLKEAQGVFCQEGEK